MEQALRPYAVAGVALLGAGMIAVTPVLRLPVLPELQTTPVQLSATEADAFAVLINVLDPGAFANGISATPTDSLGDVAVSLDQIIDMGGTPYITAADNLATDLLPLLDITSLFNGVTTSLDSLLTALTNLPNLSALLSELGNLPTATQIATAVISALTGAGGALTTITTDLTNLPTTLSTDLVNALTGAGGPLATITSDLTSLLSTDTTITGDLTTISGELTSITGDLTSLLGHFGL